MTIYRATFDLPITKEAGKEINIKHRFTPDGGYECWLDGKKQNAVIIDNGTDMMAEPDATIKYYQYGVGEK